MIGKIKIAACVILAVLTVVIVLQNTEQVETKLLFISISMPRAAMLAGTLAIGFMLGVLTAGRLMRAKKHDA